MSELIKNIETYLNGISEDVIYETCSGELYENKLKKIKSDYEINIDEIGLPLFRTDSTIILNGEHMRGVAYKKTRITNHNRGNRYILEKIKEIILKN